jgi:hypothetical protein
LLFILPDFAAQERQPTVLISKAHAAKENAVSPQHRPLLGRQEYTEALDQLIGLAGRTLRIFDHNLEGAGYESPARAEALRTFLAANPANRLYLVAHDLSHLSRNCPRLLDLLKHHGHAIEVRETVDEAKGVYDPFAVADEQHYVHRFHYQQNRAELALEDPGGAHALVKRFEEIWLASVPGAPATTLGI